MHNERYLYKTLNYKSSSCDIQGFHRLVASLVSRFEDIKPANQKNIPQDASVYLFLYSHKYSFFFRDVFALSVYGCSVHAAIDGAEQPFST